VGDLIGSLTALRHDVRTCRQDARALRGELQVARRRVDELLRAHARETDDRAGLAAFSGAKLLADAFTLEGSPSRRLRARRLVVGEPFVRPFATFLGVTECVSEAADVRELWDRLMTSERADDALRGRVSTVIEVERATVSLPGHRALRVSVDDEPSGTEAAGIVAVPRFTYAFLPRKLNNFGHWLLDCLPHVVALRMVAPDATILLPPSSKPFVAATLDWIGLPERQRRPWSGAPLRCERLLVLENDGRTGGGRPLSPLMELRRVLQAGQGPPAAPARLIYVTRRDARKKRRWVVNEVEVEAVFRSRGFEIVNMGECPLDEQARIFRDAHIVAGVSGAGLTDIIFSAAGTQVIVLVPDSLIRWYADQRGAKSVWARGHRAGPGRLAALGDSPRFHAHVAVSFGQTCHTFVGPDQMPIDRLGAFLDDVLRRVNR
jgi:hypothetical protein